MNPALVCKEENLGAEPPTGSAQREGTGDPWAGHERLNGLLDASFRLELVSLPENFGVDPPTGSIKDKKVTKITKGVEWETLGQNKRLGVINN